MADSQISRRTMLLVLHPAIALTGLADAVTGPMLPALARTFHFSDSQSGVLLFCVFSGMATGALLCVGDYARVLTRGLVALSFAGALFPFVPHALLYPFAFLFGVSVGVPMTAVSLFAGRNYTERRAATLTLLNFSWSAGALVAPLLVARMLAVASWKTVYLVVAGAAAVTAIAAQLSLRDSPETARNTPETSGLRNVRMVALFSIFFFLEVGMEVTFGAWTSTYVLRSTGVSITRAAAAVALFWGGFLASRGISPLVLLRVRPGNLLRIALVTAVAASAILLATRSEVLMAAAILLQGIALAPVFPVALSAFFDRARHSSDSRFVLAVSGFGGSVIPWIVGLISSQSGSLRLGLLVTPVVLLTMALMLPWLRVTRPVVAQVAPAPELR